MLKLVHSLTKMLKPNPNIILYFKVYQRNDIHRSATANLNIIVLDQNDKRPIFDQQIYRTKLDEHSSKGTLVTRVHANDEDTVCSLSNRRGSVK